MELNKLFADEADNEDDRGAGFKSTRAVWLTRCFWERGDCRRDPCRVRLDFLGRRRICGGLSRNVERYLCCWFLFFVSYTTNAFSVGDCRLRCFFLFRGILRESVQESEKKGTKI